jgi:hypothetical protein
MFLIVNAEDAFFRYPLHALSHYKLSYSLVPYIFQIFDFAHAVFRTVAFIDVLQPLAGKFQAITAEFATAFPASAQAAVHTGCGHVLLRAVAAVARILLPQAGFADTAVHPARGDKIRRDRIFHSESSAILLMFFKTLRMASAGEADAGRRAFAQDVAAKTE